MLFAIQRFLFAFLLVISIFVVTACSNRPAAERWKYTSYHAELTAKPVDYLYAPKIEADGSLSANSARQLTLFLNETGYKSGDQILINTQSSYRGEGAGQWITYWLEGQKIQSALHIGSLDTISKKSEAPEVQLTVRRYKLSLPDCERNMNENISNISSVTKKVVGCANLANLGHMIAKPSDLVLGSPTEPQNTIAAVRSIEEYWAGTTKALIVDQFDALSNAGGGN